MPETFNSGLSATDEEKLYNLKIELRQIISRIEELGRHRSYSLAQTKIEEAIHWLRDRAHKPA